MGSSFSPEHHTLHIAAFVAKRRSKPSSAIAFLRYLDRTDLCMVVKIWCQVAYNQNLTCGNDPIQESIQACNNSYHSGIGNTPNYVLENFDNYSEKYNENNKKYVKRFDKLKRETFKVNQKVLVNKELRNKLDPYYDKDGVIIDILENDSYNVLIGNKLRKTVYVVDVFSSFSPISTKSIQSNGPCFLEVCVRVHA